jgi:uncharacterized membrane protein YphA (DoxX/SURF4 family)
MENYGYLHHEGPATWKQVVGIAAAVFLGMVLLVAAWSKAIDPESFVEQIRFEGLDFFGLAAMVAYIAIVIEVALGMALGLGIRRWWVLAPTIALVLFFLCLTGRAYWRFEQGLITEADNCGCFGNLLARTPAQAFWQDLFLLGVPLLLSFVGLKKGERRVPRFRLALVGITTVAALILALEAPELPLDDLATRLRPGVEVGELCAGRPDSAEWICLDTLIANLDRGRHWVVVSGLEEESFLAAVPQLNETTLAGKETQLWVVSSAAPETLANFMWTQAPAFDVREAPEAMLRPLHRQLPRSFLVEDGVVMETWSGLPPEAI